MIGLEQAGGAPLRLDDQPHHRADGGRWTMT
jgi:hypothetical protein